MHKKSDLTRISALSMLQADKTSYDTILNDMDAIIKIASEILNAPEALTADNNYTKICGNLREDIPSQSISQADILMNTTASSDGYVFLPFDTVASAGKEK